MPPITVNCKLTLIKEFIEQFAKSETKSTATDSVHIVGEEILLESLITGKPFKTHQPAILMAREFHPYLVYLYSFFSMQGIILTSYSIDYLREAIRTVGGGNYFLRPDILKEMYHQGSKEVYGRLEKLTPTEQSVIYYILDGLSNQEIATALGCQRRTAESHKYRVFKKLLVDSSIQLQNLISDYAPWLGQR